MKNIFFSLKYTLFVVYLFKISFLIRLIGKIMFQKLLKIKKELYFSFLLSIHKKQKLSVTFNWF